MKTRKVMALLGSSMLAGALVLTGCNIGDDGIRLKVNGTEVNVRAELDDDLTGEDYGEVPEDDEELHCCCVLGRGGDFVSTNGELEGQLEYMSLVTDCSQIDWSSYPEDDTLSDVASIEDETIRSLAQAYIDQGYTIMDPDVMREYSSPALGDGEYMFTEGFYGYCLGEDQSSTVYVFRMNEELFDYFLVYSLCSHDITMGDDGTVVYYDIPGRHIEFNRETGVGTQIIYSEEQS